jgi:hypothetical protein
VLSCVAGAAGCCSAPHRSGGPDVQAPLRR